jgi:hypothetical protein
LLSIRPASEFASDFALPSSGWVVINASLDPDLELVLSFCIWGVSIVVRISAIKDARNSVIKDGVSF